MDRQPIPPTLRPLHEWLVAVAPESPRTFPLALLGLMVVVGGYVGWCHVAELREAERREEERRRAEEFATWKREAIERAVAAYRQRVYHRGRRSTRGRER